MKAFEIHTLQNGRWKIDSVFDDLELAVFEAKQMNAAGRHPGVRVVEEEFDEGSRRTAVRTIYHSSRSSESARPAPDRPAERRPPPAPRPERPIGANEAPAAPSRAPAGQAGAYRVISILAAVAVLGLAALFGFRTL